MSNQCFFKCHMIKMITFELCNIFEQIWYSESILEFISIQPSKEGSVSRIYQHTAPNMGPSLEFINIQPQDGGSASRIHQHQPKYGGPPLGKISVDLVVLAIFVSKSFFIKLFFLKWKALNFIKKDCFCLENLHAENQVFCVINIWTHSFDYMSCHAEFEILM